MKRYVALLFVCLFAFTFSIPSFATFDKSSQVVSSYTENIEDDIICITTVYLSSHSPFSFGERQGYVNKDYYHKGNHIASVILGATFTYNGSTATATSASGSHSVASGWSYAGQSTWCSGATAHLSASLSGPVTIPVNLSLTCSPGGTLT